MGFRGLKAGMNSFYNLKIQLFSKENVSTCRLLVIHCFSSLLPFLLSFGVYRTGHRAVAMLSKYFSNDRGRATPQILAEENSYSFILFPFLLHSLYSRWGSCPVFLPPLLRLES